MTTTPKALPALPEGWPARFRCDSCDGNGEIGEPMHMGHLQPPERERCPDCGGRGWSVEEDAFNGGHMHDYAQQAIADHLASAGGVPQGDDELIRAIGDALLCAHDHLEMHKLERSHCNSAARIREGLAAFSAYKKRPDFNVALSKEREVADGLRAQLEWLPIEQAPKDGTELLLWREDCGQFIGSYTSADSFPLTQEEIDATDEETLFAKDWFTQWPQALRLEGSEAPTHFQRLPAPPIDAALTAHRESRGTK